MSIAGYADRFSVRAGESISFMVSCDRPQFGARLARLRGPLIPGRVVEPETVVGPFEGTFPGRVQPVPIGSWLKVASTGAPAGASGLTITCWIEPALIPAEHEQGIMCGLPGGEGGSFALVIAGDGRLRFAVEGETPATAITTEPLIAGRWYFVAARWDSATGLADLTCQMEKRGWLSARSVATESVGAARPDGFAGPLVMGSRGIETLPGGVEAPIDCYNGKLDRPNLWARPLREDEIDAIGSGVDSLDLADSLAGSWDFSANLKDSIVVNRAESGEPGICFNQPMRGVTGANWTGSETCPRLKHAEYGAIAFHEDDLTDCKWAVDFQFEVPADLAPGIYAVFLASGEESDHIPFVVRRQAGSRHAPVLVMLPTNTYLAYGNERLFRGIEVEPTFIEKSFKEPVQLTGRDYFLMDHPELGSSVYDIHPDGSGICYSTRLRPVVTMRADSVSWSTLHPRHLSADLYLIEWLERQGIAYEVVTDEDLHLEGVDLLREYRAVLTGSHPEYPTGPMLDALEEYLGTGGKMMYLGGNGFYWVTGIDRDNPAVIEVRRGINGTRAWNSHPGEIYLSTTGELGGLWRNRGRAPNRLAGIGFAAQGWGGAPGYVQVARNGSAKVEFVFDGIGQDEVIGEFGLIMGGAAGDEIDRFDPQLGSPPETVRLATTEGLHSDYYQLVIEDCTFSLAGRGGAEEPRVRADMVLLQDPEGGAVFSTGSINWIGSLMWNDGDNNVSRITSNVLRHFIDA